MKNVDLYDKYAALVVVTSMYVVYVIMHYV